MVHLVSHSLLDRHYKGKWDTIGQQQQQQQ